MEDFDKVSDKVCDKVWEEVGEDAGAESAGAESESDSGFLNFDFWFSIESGVGNGEFTITVGSGF